MGNEGGEKGLERVTNPGLALYLETIEIHIEQLDFDSAQIALAEMLRAMEHISSEPTL